MDLGMLSEYLNGFSKKPAIIFLAGPISPRGISEDDYWKNIRRMIRFKNEIEESYNAVVMCPADDVLGYLVCSELASEASFKIRNMHKITACDIVVALPGWWLSQGARDEILWGRQLGKKIIEVKDEEIN